jgi:hypothetical protein
MEYFLNIFNKISFSGNAIADLAFFAAAAFTAVTSVILFFHWRKYGLGGKALILAEFLYFGIAAVLLAAAFLKLK